MNTPRDVKRQYISPNQMESRMYQQGPTYQQQQMEQLQMQGRGIRMLEPIIQTKIVEVPKEVYVQKIIEVPQVKTIEKVVEDIRPIYKYKNVYKKKQVFVEKVKHVEKIIYEEKIIEVPQNKYVEKYVDVPVYVNREKIIQVPKYMVVEKVIPVLKTTKKEKVVETPEIEAPKINIYEHVRESEPVPLHQLEQNQTTEVVLEEDLKLLNELHESKNDAKNNTSMNVLGEETIRMENYYDNTHHEETAREYEHPNQNQSIYEQMSQNLQYDQVISQRCPSIQKSNYPAYSVAPTHAVPVVSPPLATQQPQQPQQHQQQQQQQSQYNYVNRAYQPKGGYVVPKIKIAKTPHPKTNKGCYCSCD